jgi:hypothetical protein
MEARRGTWASDILAFPDAVLLPKVVSVIHCRGHQKGKLDKKGEQSS